MLVREGLVQRLGGIGGSTVGAKTGSFLAFTAATTVFF